MVLFIDACARMDSRTRRLAGAVLEKLPAGGSVITRKLFETELIRLNEQNLNHRFELIETGSFNDTMFECAREFAAADEIVIAAPYWDLSFPGILKQYLENICVTGITFRYSTEGIPIGMCAAKRLTYVTTAGGKIFNHDYGYGYVAALAKVLFGIPQTRMYSAEMLDVDGFDAEAIIKNAIQKINEERED